MKARRDGHNRAREWLKSEGRGIDLAYTSWISGGSATVIVNELLKFQNNDGGFGHALEPDVRLSGSSVLATSVALQHASRLDLAASHPVVSGAMQYLSSSFDAATGLWKLVPDHVDDAPHAPWWGPRKPGDGQLNPRAELLAYYWRWGSEGIGEKTLDVLTSAVASLIPTSEELEMHEILTIDRLVSEPGLPDHIREGIEATFRTAVVDRIGTDPSGWVGYGIAPLSIVKSPNHRLADELSSSIEIQLDQIEASQQVDGSWIPPWSWFGEYPETWPEAERDIRSFVTADNVGLLSRFGRY